MSDFFGQLTYTIPYSVSYGFNAKSSAIVNVHWKCETYFLWQGHFHSFRTYIFELIILTGLIFASLKRRAKTTKVKSTRQLNL